SIDTSRLSTVPSQANSGTTMTKSLSMRERRKRAKGAAKLALVIASLPVSLVKRIRYLAQHGPNYNKGFDGRTPVADSGFLGVPDAGSSSGRPKSVASAAPSEGLAGEPDTVSHPIATSSPTPGATASPKTGGAAAPGGRRHHVSAADGEIKFYVELERVKNLPGLSVVDFKRLRGDIWAFKRLYHDTIGRLPIRDDDAHSTGGGTAGSISGTSLTPRPPASATASPAL
ncbi:hypothetical protein HK405_002194, partial [Cladochytrium tenue]